MNQRIHIQPPDSDSFWCEQLNVESRSKGFVGTSEHYYMDRELDQAFDSMFGAQKWNYCELCIAARDDWHNERAYMRRKKAE